MSFGENMDYSYLKTWWLFGPISVFLSFVIGFIVWQTWKCIVYRKQEKSLKRINSEEKNKSYSSFDTLKSSKFLIPKDVRINIQFTNLGLRLRSNGKKVLDGVTGEIKSGRMTAVMGPSGSGKTTFMTTIAGKAYYGKMIGKILINNRSDLPIYKFKNSTGFVPQEDVMLREMTVEETLLFSAKTRLPKTMSKNEKIQIVEDVLEILDLKPIRYSIIGDENVRGISGGQRKRVNIGIELVSDPTLLFLDEPTSGLDSSSSMSICSALRKISKIGLTIVAVIHQPRYEIFQLFHDVLLLAKGGRTVYQGPTNKALKYFNSLGYECPVHSNPADFLIDIISELQPNKNGEYIPTDELVSIWKKRRYEEREKSSSDDDNSNINNDLINNNEEIINEEINDSDSILLYNDYSNSNNNSNSIQFHKDDISDNNDIENIDEDTELFSEDKSYDNGINPISLDDIVIIFKKIYYYSKATIEKQIPALTMTKEELFKGENINNELYSFDNEGKIYTGIIMFFISIFTFIFLPFAFFKLPFEKTRPSLCRQYGGIFAIFFLFLVTETIYFFRFISIFASNDDIIGIGYFGIILYCIIPSGIVFILFIVTINHYKKEKKPIPFIKEFVGGLYGWLFYIGYKWNHAGDISIPKRMSMVIGFLSGGYFILILTSSILLQSSDSCNSCPSTTLPFLPETIGVLIFYLFVVFLLARRMHVLPLNLRSKPSFKYQLLQITKRSFIQITRNWIIYVFDLLLVINAGIFVGIIYYQQYYEPPIIDSLPSGECPENLSSEACKILSIPQQDPFSGQASITCLALALAAVASSLRIFGDERVIFRRESTSGLSTEAYYCGKSIAHLPTEIIAPLMFSLCYYALILPISPFYQYFFLYFLIYWSCAGLAFLVSLVSPPSLSQLAGVLTILTFMMFSGAAPTLDQLKDNLLLPYVLWGVSWLSLFRYTQELYYLIGISPYNPSPDTATLIYYGYTLEDKILCWLMIFALGIVFRFLAYIALVIRERRQ